MLLPEIIKQKIKESGPISFHDFMEMALYYPALGYYTSAKEKIGLNGDFYTSSSLTPAFGAAIARQLEQMWELLGRKPFTIVELGAGTGILCFDILSYLRRNECLYEQLEYCIIEKSDTLRQQQQQNLKEKVSWYSSVSELKNISGCILSNELLDNFSVHQVVMQDELMEVFVDDDHGLVERLQPASKEILEYFAALKISIPKGFRTEVNLEMTSWIKDISAILTKGYVITIDYGFTSAELYQERRRNGTLICYHKHDINENPYTLIGEQDITAHVNFSALCYWGFQNGLCCTGLTSQADFLLALGFKELLRNMLDNGEDILTIVKKEARISYTMLVDMGSRYRVLVQQKGIPRMALMGLPYQHCS
ncbi:MAG: SAM-dependent methyltransferase [Bacteroidota bacterium]